MGTSVDRQIDALIDLCHQGLDAGSLRVQALQRIRRIVSVDAAFFATVDPVTLLFTSAMSEEPLEDVALQFLDNEYGAPDVNRFTELAGRADPIASLDGATGGHRGESRRFTQIMAPLDLGDELRVVLRSRGHDWGVLCLHRMRADTGFSATEIGMVRGIAPHLAEGLRRAYLITTGGAADAAQAGIVLLDDQLRPVSMNAVAERRLADISDDQWPSSLELPLPIYTVAARARSGATRDGATSAGSTGAAGRAEARIRTSTGAWLLVHGSRLSGAGGSQIAVVIEPASAERMMSVLLAARGLTPAQERVATLVLRGLTSREMAARAHISTATVQEHLKAVFDKFGVHSRRELVTAVLSPASPRP